MLAAARDLYPVTDAGQENPAHQRKPSRPGETIDKARRQSGCARHAGAELETRWQGAVFCRRSGDLPFRAKPVDDLESSFWLLHLRPVRAQSDRLGTSVPHRTPQGGMETNDGK
jgi:hypothetical protein